MPDFVGPLASGAALFVAISRYGYFIDGKLDQDFRNKLCQILVDTKHKSRNSVLLDLFSSIFDKLFAARKSGRPSFVRSALASLLILAAITVIWALVSPERVVSSRGLGKPENIAGLAILLCTVNFLGDYVSLWQSRIIVGLMATSRNILEQLMWLVIDFFATVTIYILSTLLIFAVGFELMGDWDFGHFTISFSGPHEHQGFLWDLFFGGMLAFSGYSNYPDIFALCFYTTLFTSVWVYAFMLGNIFWPMFSVLRDFLNIEKYPVGASMTIGGAILGTTVMLSSYLV